MGRKRVKRRNQASQNLKFVMDRRHLNKVTSKRLMTLVKQGWIKVDGVMLYAVEYAAKKCIDYDGSNPEILKQLQSCKILYSNDTEKERLKNLLMNIGLHPTEAKFVKL